MAVTMVSQTNVKRWVGLSTEVRPAAGYPDAAGVVLTSADVPTGSTYYRTDDGLTETWDGTIWRLAVSDQTVMGSSILALAARMDETNRLLRKLILGLELNFNNGEFPEAE